MGGPHCAPPGEGAAASESLFVVLLLLLLLGSPGNSGSPVFELQRGTVIGVINSVIVKQSREAAITNPSGITYAIPVNFVRELLQ